MAEREEGPNRHWALARGDEAAGHEINGLFSLRSPSNPQIRAMSVPKCGLRPGRGEVPRYMQGLRRKRDLWLGSVLPNAPTGNAVLTAQSARHISKYIVCRREPRSLEQFPLRPT